MHLTFSLTLLTLLSSLSASVYTQGPADTYAPKIFGRPQGLDTGNKACAGVCVLDPALLACEHKEFRSKYGCFMCCISDDDLDRLDESFGPLDGSEDTGDEDDE
ncbi:uncharacterized protein BDV17DRAFT_292611 [Aspergillus undulatus]|uniref:uncharacterized protein n=1 Tax=Aspergillus undulatus TaxID=1810928 RepID=UPI003CCD5C59